jgi:hypothetical protein
VTTTDGTAGALLRFDLHTGRPTGKVDLPGPGGTPNWIALGAGAVWLTDSGAHSRLLRVDPETMRLTGSRAIECTDGQCAGATGGRAVWVVATPSAGRVRLVPVDSGTLRVNRVIVAPRPDLGTGFALDGTTIWWNGNETVRLDAQTAKILTTIPLLAHPSLFAGPSAIVTGGGSIWEAIAAPR